MKRKISKTVCAALAAILFVLAGCGDNLPAGAFKDEILSKIPLEKGKMTVSIRAEFNVNNNALLEALKTKFPEVDFLEVFHCAPETQYELRQSLTGSAAEDIIISPNMKSISDIAPQYLLDLSAEKYTESYAGPSLEGCQINGKLYYLPGPSSLFGIIYDKTMFAEHGWQVPHSYDEFIALVGTIEASGIRAFQPTCKYARQAQLVLTMFDYAETFGGVENYDWLNDYRCGKTSLAGHIGAALDRYLELRNAGVISSPDFDVQPGDRSKMMYTDHTCAMIIETEQAENYAVQYKSDHEYGMLPFWCGNDENSDYLMSMPNYYIGVNASLGKSENSAKLAKVREILSYISTPEGQLAISGGKMTQISNVTGTPYDETGFNSGIISTINKGNLVPEVELMASGNNNAAEKALKADLPGLLDGTLTREQLISDTDAARDAALNSGIDRGEKYATASETFTRLQTGLFIADALRAKAGADIGLCLVGTIRRGMIGRIYKGDVCAADVSALSLSNGTGGTGENDKKLWLVSLTGAQLTELLRQGCEIQTEQDGVSGTYFTASGLNIVFAPWRDEKLVSVTLSDGSALGADTAYTVALWGWPFETPCAGTVLKVFPETSDEILSEAVKNAGALSPSSDGRFKLIYDK